MKMQSQFRKKTFAEGSVLLLEGATPTSLEDALFVIASGSVAVFKHSVLSDGEEVVESQVAQLESGKAVGELALMGGAQGKRNSTVKVVGGEAECYVLNKSEFDSFMQDQDRDRLLRAAEKAQKDLHRYDPFMAELDPMLRLYWAVVTGRHRLAEVFWMQNASPFVGSFMCSYVCRRLGARNKDSHSVKKDSHSVNKDSHSVNKDDQAMRDWDAKANDLLKALKMTLKKSVQLVFDQYVFFGTEEEENVACGERTDWSMLTGEQRQQNASLRSALALMGVNGNAPMTRIDLAILAQNKMFMGNEATSAFMDEMWSTKCGNGYWVDTLMNASPYQKYISQICGNFGLLYLYIYVFFTMPHVNKSDSVLQHTDGSVTTYTSWTNGPETVEITFWLCALVQLVYEIYQVALDFRGRSFSAYLEGSGNKYDFVINLTLIIALVCRIVSTVMAQNAGLQGVELCAASIACDIYTTMQASLSITLFCFILRILYSFSASRRLGVLQIIVHKIAIDDVGPFMLYCLVVIFNFEVTAQFFTWYFEMDLNLADTGERSIFWSPHFGSYFFSFSDSISSLRLESDKMEPMDRHLGLPNGAVWGKTNWGWEAPDLPIRIVKVIFDTAFFLLTVVILMNLLIAMMANTFAGACT